ncbi:hypothetical protein ACWEKT_08415 [Nocardia takedensis]
MPASHALARTEGLFSLDAAHLDLLDEVDRRITDWARTLGARPERHAELHTRRDLNSIGYFESFPHLAHRVGPVLDTDPSEELYLTSAACYGVYFARVESGLVGEQVVTVRHTCRRRESEYRILRRQREFQMREVVVLGEAARVADLVEQGVVFMSALAAEYGIRAEPAIATDPFFRKDDPRLTYQRVIPTKRELVDDTGLAIASVNLHRTFFGERCAITLPGGEPISSGCVAFGLERWVDAVLRARREP